MVEVGVRLVLVAAGVVLGVVGAFVHPLRLTVAGARVPVLLPVVLVALLALVVAAGVLGRGRPAAVLVAAAWLVTTVAFALPGPGGDLVVTGEVVSLVYLAGGMVVAAVGVGSTPEVPLAAGRALRRRRAGRTPPEPPPVREGTVPERHGTAR